MDLIEKYKQKNLKRIKTLRGKHAILINGENCFFDAEYQHSQIINFNNVIVTNSENSYGYEN